MPAQTPEECDALFAEYVNAGDIDALVDLYEPSACLVQQTGTEARGTKAIREALAALVDMRPRLTMNVTRVARAGDDLAVLYNQWSMIAKDGISATVTAGGKAIEIVRRQADGSWRFAIDDPFARG
jgi:uncharacterized protein (TIGR02246 family)